MSQKSSRVIAVQSPNKTSMTQHILLAEFGVTEMSIGNGFGIHATIK